LTPSVVNPAIGGAGGIAAEADVLGIAAKGNLAFAGAPSVPALPSVLSIAASVVCTSLKTSSGAGASRLA
jgi:hypothetical protein